MDNTSIRAKMDMLRAELVELWMSGDDHSPRYKEVIDEIRALLCQMGIKSKEERYYVGAMQRVIDKKRAKRRHV